MCFKKYLKFNLVCKNKKEFRNIMNMKDRFWARLSNTCSILVAIWDSAD